MALLLIQNFSCCEGAEQKHDKMCFLLHPVHLQQNPSEFYKGSRADSAVAVAQGVVKM